MNIKITRSRKLEKLQPLHIEDHHVIEDFTNEEWELLYRRLRHFNGNELMIKLDVDTFNRLGEEEYIPYAVVYVDGKALYVITSFDVYSYNILMKLEERTGAFLLDKSKILREMCREVVNNNGEDVEWYDLELSEHIERELNYQLKNNINVPMIDPIVK